MLISGLGISGVPAPVLARPAGRHCTIGRFVPGLVAPSSHPDAWIPYGRELRATLRTANCPAGCGEPRTRWWPPASPWSSPAWRRRSRHPNHRARGLGGARPGGCHPGADQSAGAAGPGAVRPAGRLAGGGRPVGRDGRRGVADGAPGGRAPGNGVHRAAGAAPRTGRTDARRGRRRTGGGPDRRVLRAGADPFRLFGWTGPAGGSDRLRGVRHPGQSQLRRRVPHRGPACRVGGGADAGAAVAPGPLLPGAALVAGGILATGSRAPVAAVLAGRAGPCSAARRAGPGWRWGRRWGWCRRARLGRGA